MWARIPNRVKGAICMVGVTLMFQAMDASAKILGQRYDPFFVVWVRYLVQVVVVTLAVAHLLPGLLVTRQLPLQLLRSSFLFGATVLFFWSLALMPLADVAAVAQVAPLIITAMAAIFLAERVGLNRWLGVFVGFVGALIILRPGFGDTGWEVLLPLGAALCFSALNITTRFLEGVDSVWTTFLYTGLVGTVAATAAVPWFWETPAWSDVPIFLAMGLFGTLGQFLLIMALTYATASLLAPLLYLNLVWATALGFVLFADLPDHWTILGAAMIVAAGLYVQRSGRSKTDRTGNE